MMMMMSRVEEKSELQCGHARSRVGLRGPKTSFAQKFTRQKKYKNQPPFTTPKPNHLSLREEFAVPAPEAVAGGEGSGMKKKASQDLHGRCEVTLI
jgi:hypothetical protein